MKMPIPLMGVLAISYFNGKVMREFEEIRANMGELMGQLDRLMPDELKIDKVRVRRKSLRRNEIAKKQLQDIEGELRLICSEYINAVLGNGRPK